MTSRAPQQLAAQVVRQWPGGAKAQLRPVAIGLINDTFFTELAGGAPVVLQRLHPIFAPEVNEDIEVVTAHLARRGLATPRLVRTTKGQLYYEQAGCWRVQTRLPGHTVSRATGPQMVGEAGRLLGSFHRALGDLEYDFRFTRKAHGLRMHHQALLQACHAHGTHRLHERVARMAEALTELATPLPAIEALPARITHGDPKLSNILFLPPEDRAHALVDLDTLGPLALPVELGDALRSWCNPAGEDGGQPHLDLAYLEAALSGYGAQIRDWLRGEERELLVTGLLVICVELACRFAADALNESYFGWNPDQFASRGEHNLHRAEVQLRLARSVLQHQAAAERLVQKLTK